MHYIQKKTKKESTDNNTCLAVLFEADYGFLIRELSKSSDVTGGLWFSVSTYTSIQTAKFQSLQVDFPITLLNGSAEPRERSRISLC